MEKLEEMFEYRDGALYWLIKPAKKIRVGDRAGCLTNYGYRQIKFKGSLELEHRLIWQIFNGPIPEGVEIDHINRVRTDNRIENLRLATRGQNCVNMLGSGYTYLKQSRKYKAQIKIQGKTKCLGYFDTAEEASQVYQTAWEERIKENFDG